MLAAGTDVRRLVGDRESAPAIASTAARRASTEVFLGTYPVGWPDDDLPHLDDLATLPVVRGFEIPWRGEEALVASAARIARTAPGRRMIVTDIAWVMSEADPSLAIGLASPSDLGRARAVAEAASIARSVRRVHDEVSADMVAAVEVHTAPSRVGSASALRRSLETLTQDDWSGAELLIEHVDAARPGHAPAKGFLDLEDELDAAQGLPVGVALNWARSAIEFRDPDLVTRHIEACRSAEALRALFFSGVAAERTVYGPAWADAHLPFSETDTHSLLTPARLGAALQAAGSIPIVGVKIAHEPRREAFAAISASLAGVLTAVSGLEGS